MLKMFAVYLSFVVFSCTPTNKKSDKYTVNGNYLATPCTTTSPGPRAGRPTKHPKEALEELREKINLHPYFKDIEEEKEEVMDFVLLALTSRFPSFDDLDQKNVRFKPKININLVPYFHQCCENELKASLYKDYGSCLDRIFNRVIRNNNSFEDTMLLLGKNILGELSISGRKGWCRYIDYEWLHFRRPDTVGIEGDSSIF